MEPPSARPTATAHHLLLRRLIVAMALDSVPPYPCDFGSTTATARTQQRIRKDERTWTSDTYAPYDDGHQWRKYGEKKLSNSNFPRFYYRCTYKNDMKCPATKQVQQKDAISDPPMFSVTYFNHHTCSSSSSSTPLAGSPRSDTASRSSSKKAMSICFSTQASSESPSFRLTPVATTTPRPPAMRSYRSSSAYQQPEGSSSACYAHHPFRWTGVVPSPTTSNNGRPAKIEAACEPADQAIGHSSSSSGGGAPSRTLLPIGQSRCIEYFHFL